MCWIKTLFSPSIFTVIIFIKIFFKSKAACCSTDRQVQTFTLHFSNCLSLCSCVRSLSLRRFFSFLIKTTVCSKQDTESERERTKEDQMRQIHCMRFEFLFYQSLALNFLFTYVRRLLFMFSGPSFSSSFFHCSL